MIFSKKKEPQSNFLVFLLLEEHNTELNNLSAIRMAQKSEYGGAWVSVGDSILIPWEEIRKRGLVAFEKLRAIPADAAENNSFASLKKNSRKRKVVLVEIGLDEMVLSPERKIGRQVRYREEERMYLDIPISNDALSAAIAEALSRSR